MEPIPLDQATANFIEGNAMTEAQQEQIKRRLQLASFLSGVFTPKPVNTARDLRVIDPAPPTITTGQVASWTAPLVGIPGGVFIGWDDPRIVLRGAATWSSGGSGESLASGGLTGSFNELMTTAEFVIVGDSFEINWFGVPTVRRVWINGRLINSQNYGIVTGFVQNQPCASHFQFSTHGERRIKIENFRSVRGIRVSNRGCLKAPYDVNAVKPKLMIVGDSLVEGTGAALGHSGFTSWLGEMLNCDVIRSGSGGTGLISTGIPGRFNYLGRIQDVAAIQPEVLVLWCSINDSSFTYTADTITNYLDAVTRVSPRTKIIVVGPLWVTTPAGANTMANDAVARNAAASLGLPYISAVEPSREFFTSQNNAAYMQGTTATVGAITRSGNVVTAIAVGSGGVGYTRPTVACSVSGGGGTGCEATANVTLGVGAIHIIDPGMNIPDGEYTLTFAPTGAVGTATVAGGKIVSYVITTAGSYTSEPSVTLAGLATNNSYGIVLAAHLVGPVTSITVNAGGTGYTSDPTVTISAPGADGTHPNPSGHDMIMERLAYEIKKLMK